VPLFQSLLVLATGRQVRAGVDERGSTRSFSTVTVEVEPEHAQRLVVAQRAGKLTAVLRNPDDLQRMARKPMDVRQLLELPSAAAAPRTSPQLIVGGLGRVPAYPPEGEQVPEQPASEAPPRSPTVPEPVEPLLPPASRDDSLRGQPSERTGSSSRLGGPGIPGIPGIPGGSGGVVIDRSEGARRAR
jgi:hypothetical protein